MKNPTEQQFTEQLDNLHKAKYGVPLPNGALSRLRQLGNQQTEAEPLTLLAEVAAIYRIRVSHATSRYLLNSGNYLVRDYYQHMLLEKDNRKERLIRRSKQVFSAAMLATAVYFISQGQGVFALAAALMGMETMRELNKQSGSR
jgi:predicted KAP-like P-loop ATPase